MEYIKDSGKKSDELVAAIKRLEQQIAQKLMAVHNECCELKLQSPDDVYAFMSYGRNADGAIAEKMEPFVELNDQFMEIGHGLDEGSNCPRATILQMYQDLEKALQEEIAKM